MILHKKLRQTGITAGLPEHHKKEEKMKMRISMDEVISKVAALGITGLILLIAIHATGLAGAAAITMALSSIGPGGMVGGLVTLGVATLIVEGIAKYGYERILEGVLKTLHENGESKESLINKIDNYPITRKLKL